MRSIHLKVGIGGILLAAFLTVPALANSKVSYLVTLGGDNHAANWKLNQRPLYTGGTETDGQYFQKSLPLSYAIKLKAEGIHSQVGHASNGYEIFGAANTVFNVALYKDSVAPANLATSATFYSTINDGTGTDPQANAAFATCYSLFGIGGRVIDPETLGGPRMEPIFTYPTAQPGKLIGQGAGYKEWNMTGSFNVQTYPGVGMDLMPDGYGGHTTGLGVAPVAEGQINISTLADGTYILQVTPGAGNNVLRGDLNMLAATNRPAFAVAANETAGDTITFRIGASAPCSGVVGRYMFYNNSAWDTASDDAAIATDKQALLPGQTTSIANYSSYSKSLNGIMVDVCTVSGTPAFGSDIMMAIGNTNDPFSWPLLEIAPTITVRPGAGVNGSDRVVITWADNAIPNKNWILVGLMSGGAFSIPADDVFCFGICKGESTGEGTVNASDEIAARNHLTGFTPATITNIYDYNRDKAVNATDQIISRNNPTGFTPLKMFTWN